MADLVNYTISHDAEIGGWLIKRDGAKRALKRFKAKDEAVAHAAGRFGVENPASVKIQKIDGTIEEERTYPRSMDPRASKG